MDCPHADYTDAPTDPIPWDEDCTSRHRGLRGGSYASPPLALRTAARTFGVPDEPIAEAGVRCVRDLPACQDPALDCPSHPLGWPPECNERGYCSYYQEGDPYHAVEIYAPPGIWQVGAFPEEAESDAGWGMVRVRGERGFFIDAYEVTVGEYGACMTAEACPAPMEQPQGHSWGVVNVPGTDDPNRAQNGLSHERALALCRWLGKRLPSVAEWELVAAGRRHRLSPWGDAPSPTCLHAVMNEGGHGCGNEYTLPVGSRPLGRSALGALDMLGSIYEAASDCGSAPSYVPPGDASPAVCSPDVATPSFRFRGGSAASSSRWCSVDLGGLGGEGGDRAEIKYGARCVRDLPEDLR